MSEIKDRQDAASDIDPIVAALADDISTAAAVEGFGDAAETDEASALRPADGAGADESDGAASTRLDPITVAAADAIEVALAIEAMPSEAGDAPYADPPLPTPLEQMTATYADTVVELEAPADDDDGPLLDDELEHGIASVFAALHAAAQGDAGPVEPLGDLEAADGVTFRLLGELDRIWHRAA